VILQAFRRGPPKYAGNIRFHLKIMSKMSDIHCSLPAIWK